MTWRFVFSTFAVYLVALVESCIYRKLVGFNLPDFNDAKTLLAICIMIAVSFFSGIAFMLTFQNGTVGKQPNFLEYLLLGCIVSLGSLTGTQHSNLFYVPIALLVTLFVGIQTLIIFQFFWIQRK